MPDCLFYSVFRNFIKCNAINLLVLLLIELQSLLKMPGNRFSFAVRVGREINFICLLHRLAKSCQHISLSADGYIFRLKIMFGVKSHLTFRKITNMSA